MIHRRSVLSYLLAAPAWSGLAWADLAQGARDRIDDLLARMTIAEKAGQLSCFSDTVRPLGRTTNPGEAARDADAMLAAIRAGQVGMLFNGYGVAGARRAQRAALKSRLGIPLVFAADVIHGYETIFPIPLGEAAAFDPALSERIARAVAREATAGGLHWTFAPMVDVARDARWGRVAEGAGEDVHLGSRIAAARVRGFQGDDLSAEDALCATPKHFAGYGAVVGGMEYGAVDMSPGTMQRVHLPPFAAAFAAGAGAVMASFTDVDGVPATANRPLLTGILRGQLGFRGPCVSDYAADRELIAHGAAADEADAAARAILAGTDVSMQSGLYNAHLPVLVAAGRVPIARVDEAVRRVLALKARLGLFERPFRSLDPVVERTRIGTAATRALANEAATRAVVLLRNEGGLLPLSRTIGRIALIGPCGADRTQLDGPWSFAGYRREGVDLATALRGRLPDTRLTVEPGSAIEAPIAGGIDRAVAAARAADVVLLAIGEGADMSGEANSRASIAVPPAQQALAEAVAATGTPVVVLLRHGRALVLEGAVRAAPAILATWFLGCETGPALAALLFGEAEPTGRLPVSFPMVEGQQPWSYDRLPTGRPPPPEPAPQGGTGRWRDAPDAALYAFGHGLGYTRFAIGEAAVPSPLTPGATVTATVRNVGRRRGTHVVQLYVRQRVASRARPVRQLKGFARVTLDAGASATVSLPLGPDDLAIVDERGGRQVEPGVVDIWVASSSADAGSHATTMLIQGGERRAVFSAGDPDTL
ncbi:glycoside hydrolase family 3 C-terminal domain-containing protein [Sphingomonas sp. A2-49]|uniref:glycoside hydrolase family 3 N-terminal domain-containing protein n=1 Tax=Sphingomonas sp. A2-49 TaxID=1391375 RepID=UPI0021D26362|nr:glycoside hydrolase family 3 N-terminal domain-containing protein [Sphingomonas sp. A2-49]MCU6454539.1 glycoside hydrolase family 3 C-terminal domain-containing protein [Sphingomonas sp. A2-49]